MDPKKICTFYSWFLWNVKHGSPTVACQAVLCYARAIKIALMGQLDILLAIFPHATREPVHNNACGPLP